MNHDDRTLDIPIIPLGTDEPEATAAGVPVLPVGLQTGMQTQAGPTQKATIAKSKRLTVPGYELFDEIGRGGMGVVYRASQLSLGRDIALKFLREEYHPGSKTGIRFLEEARITAQLQHPGIPSIHEVGRLDDERPYLVMKLIQGKTLDAMLKGDGPHPTRWISIFEGICNAVGYAHARGIIHRDLKPANVMVGAFGEVQVMDWGLAKVLGAPSTEDADSAGSGVSHQSVSSSHSAAETQAGALLGTPAFMAPEQAVGAVELVDCKSDVFGLGAVLCALLTGNPPYVNRTVETTRQMAASVDQAEANTRIDSSGASPEIIALCKRCLSGDREVRPATGLELAKEIAKIRRNADERAIAAEREKAEAAVMLAEQKKRRVQNLIAGGLILAVFAAGAIVSLLQAGRATRERDNAQAAEASARQAEETARAAEQNAIDRENAERMARVEAEKVSRFMQDVFTLGTAGGQAGVNRVVNRHLTVKAAMDYVSGNLGVRFQDSPLIEAAIRKTIGRAYFELGALPEAVGNLKQSLALNEAHRGPDDVQTLEIVNELAQICQLQGDYAEAEKLMTRVLEVWRRTLGEDTVHVLSAKNNLAMLYAAKGDLVKAVAMFREILESAEKHLGPDHHTTLAYVNNLGALLDQNGDSSAAELLLVRAYEQRASKLGLEHPDTITSLNNLANLYETRKNYAKARGLLEKALAFCRSSLGEDHLTTLLIKNNLGYVVESMRGFDEAEPLYLAAYEGRVRKLGPYHGDSIVTLRNLIKNACHRKDMKSAGARLLMLADVHRQVDGLDDQSLELLKHYCELALHLHRGDEALKVFRDVFDAVYADLPEEKQDPELSAFGQACLKWGWPEEAESLFRRCLAMREKRVPGSWWIDSMNSMIGWALMDQGKYDDAFALLVKSYEGMQSKRKEIPLESQDQMRLAGQRILECCRCSGDVIKLDLWQKKLGNETAPPPRKKTD